MLKPMLIINACRLGGAVHLCLYAEKALQRKSFLGYGEQAGDFPLTAACGVPCPRSPHCNKGAGH